MRKTDVLSRYGGDEFAALLVNTDTEQAVRLMEKLNTVFEERPFLHRGVSMKISLSFGVSSFIRDSDGFESLIERADAALYSAKSLARNRVSAGQGNPSRAFDLK